MSNVIIYQRDLTMEQPMSADSPELNNVKFMRFGIGGQVILIDPRVGALWGGETEDEAKAIIRMDGTYKFKDLNGNTVIDVDGIYGQILNDALDTQAEEILGDFTFTETGAISASNDVNNGVFLTENGIVAKKNGTATVTINKTGDASFKGQIIAGSIISAGDLASGGTIKGVNVFAQSVLTASEKRDVRLLANGRIGFYLASTSGENEWASLFVEDTISSPYFRDLIVRADKGILMESQGTAGDFTVSSARHLKRTANKNIEERYNEDGTGGQCLWYNAVSDPDTLRMRLDTGGNLFADGAVTGGGADFAEWFKNDEEEIIPAGTSVYLKNGRVRKADKSLLKRLLKRQKIIGVVSDNPALVGNGDVKKDRSKKKYSLIGLVGQVKIKEGQPVKRNWIKMSKNKYLIGIN